MNVKDGKKIRRCAENNDCKFHVPGKKVQHPEMSAMMGKTCSDVMGRTLGDVPNGYPVNFETKCKPNFSKIAVVVDEDSDFHYYRQDNNGMWSHKPGAREVTNKDSEGSPIYRPDLASRYYPQETEADTGLNYDSFCSYMCVPRDKPIVLKGGKKLHTRRRQRPVSRRARN